MGGGGGRSGCRGGVEGGGDTEDEDQNRAEGHAGGTGRCASRSGHGQNPLGRMRAGLREELAVPNLVGVCIVFVPPRFFARVPRRLGELELPLAVLSLLL